MTLDPKKRLRTGYTTGACAAAAAKAAVHCLLGDNLTEVNIPFPDGSRHSFSLCRLERAGKEKAMATVVKDAGDDPDVTNGAEIGAEVRWLPRTGDESVLLTNGPGVGMVTKPGLPVAVGKPAINPVPQRMIRVAVSEALQGTDTDKAVEIKVFVRDGGILAEKTLNRRLGVVGGLSILGTTGIVRPISAKAWTDTIDASMAVARAAGLTEVILSTGRTSEAAVQRMLQLPEEAQVMMGDYLQYALRAAGRFGFVRIHLAEMWAKLVKAALAVPQTHVRNGALEVHQAADLLIELGLEPALGAALQQANTAREIFDTLRSQGRQDLIEAVSLRAQAQAQTWAGIPVRVYLVTTEEGVIHVTD